MLSEKQKERLREQRKAAYAKMKAAQKSDPIYQAKQAVVKKRSKDYYLLQKTKKKAQLKTQQMIDRQAKIDEIAQQRQGCDKMRLDKIQADSTAIKNQLNNTRANQP